MLFDKKRICALLLALALLCSMFPVGTVLAAEETELTAADYAEADLVFDLIDKAESAPATRSVTQEQKTQAAMEVVMASDSYVEGSLEQSGNSFTWWTENGIRFTAVLAAHSDPSPIGVILEDGEKKYYVTGDTLYNEEIFGDLPQDVDTVFLPINGVGNNMNMTDAARFAKRTGAKRVVPIHIGLFDSLSPEDFLCENKYIPKIYKPFNL